MGPGIVERRKNRRRFRATALPFLVTRPTDSGESPEGVFGNFRPHVVAAAKIATAKFSRAAMSFGTNGPFIRRFVIVSLENRAGATKRGGNAGHGKTIVSFGSFRKN